MNFKNVVCDKATLFHERNDFIEQRRTFIDFDHRNFQQHRLECGQDSQRTIQNLQFITLRVYFQQTGALQTTKYRIQGPQLPRFDGPRNRTPFAHDR